MKSVLNKILKNPFSMGIIATLLTLFIMWSNPFKITDHGRDYALDTLTQLFPYETLYPEHTKSLVFVDIDDQSLNTVGQWPWPRQTTATLINKISQSGALAIGIDILMPEQDRFSPESLSQVLGLPKQTLTAAGGVSGDEKLASILKGSPTVLAFALSNDIRPNLKAISAGHFVSIGEVESDLLNTTSLMLPLSAISTAPGAGFINTYKVEGLIRETPLVALYQGDMVPSLNLDMLRVAMHAENFLIKSSDFRTSLLIRAAKLKIETSNNGNMIYHHGHSNRFQRISAKDFLNGKSQDMHNKIVILGASAMGLGDVHSSNLENEVPGPLFQLQALDQMLAERFITNHLVFDFFIIGLCALLAITFSYFITRISLGYVLLAMPLALALLLASAIYSFISFGFLFNAPIAMTVLLMGPIATYLAKSLLESQLRKKIQSSFAQYVPMDIVKRISQANKSPSLGGEEIDCTILFLDIRGYTTLTETLKSDPKLLVSTIALIMNEVTERLIAQGATIDKYIGDAVMAFWNAPEQQADHQLRALKAALSITAAKETIQRMVCNLSPALENIKIDFGIGVATGPVIVGNMGSDFRFNYTVMGDAVNVASRLESLTKEKGSPILATGGMLNLQNQLELNVLQIEISSLGQTSVKGKAETMDVYAIRSLNVAN